MKEIKTMFLTLLVSMNAISIMKALDYAGLNTYYQSHWFWIIVANLIVIGLAIKYYDGVFK